MYLFLSPEAILIWTMRTIIQEDSFSIDESEDQLKKNWNREEIKKYFKEINYHEWRYEYINDTAKCKFRYRYPALHLFAGLGYTDVHILCILIVEYLNLFQRGTRKGSTWHCTVLKS